MEKTLLRCSPAVRSLGIAPTGSAIERTSFLLVDAGLPWARDVSEDQRFAPVVEAIAAAAAEGVQWRLQAMVPTEGAPRRRVIAHQLPEGGFDRYRRFAVEVDPDEVIDTAVAFIEDPAAVAAQSPSPAGEFLLCTHGRRDACCGSSGTSLWQDLVVRPDLLPEGTQLCRTSHTGGHRFAPTAIHLPSGTMWAWLDVDVVEGVVRREQPFAAVADRYRGSAALATYAEQVLEAVVLGELGWPWLEHRRRGETRGDGPVREVSLHHSGPDGRSGVWSAQVEVTGMSPIPDCGAPLEDAPKWAEILAVVPGSLRHEEHPASR